MTNLNNFIALKLIEKPLDSYDFSINYESYWKLKNPNL